MEKDPKAAARLSHGLKLQLDHRILPGQISIQSSEKNKGKAATVRYGAKGTTNAPDDECEYGYDYIFHMQGVGISSWEVIVRSKRPEKEVNIRDEDSSSSNSTVGSVGGGYERYWWSRTRYER